MCACTKIVNDLERVMAAILGYFTEFGSFGDNYVKVAEDSLQQKCSPKNLRVFLEIYDLWRYLQRLLRMSALMGATCEISTSTSVLTNVEKVC